MPKNCSRDESRYGYLQCVYIDWSGLYNASDSSTFRNVTNTRLSLTQSDETRFARGYYGTETIRFGDSQLDNVYIGIGTNFTQAPELGIGVYDSDRQTYTSFMEFLYTERDINVLAHGLYFGWLERNESYITMGSVDTAKYEGNLVTFNASTDAEITTVELLSAAFGSPGDMDELTGVINLKANVEFSTSRMSLPDAVIPLIIERTGAEWDEDWNGYLVDCDVRESDMVFEFRFRDINITVSANHFVLPAYGILGYRFQFRGNDACSLQVSPMSRYSIATDLGYEAVLGTPFARHTYLVHDYSNRQLSFAPAIFNTSESEVVVLDSSGVAPLFSATPPSESPSPETTTPAPDPSPEPTGSGSSTNVGAIAGGVVGGVVGLAGIFALGFLLVRRNKKSKANANLPPPPMMHNNMPSPPAAPGTSYSQVPAYDPMKPAGQQQTTSPISEAPGSDPRFGGYAYGGQSPGHQQFQNLPYQESMATPTYSEVPGNQAFAQELPASGPR
ncbi:Barrierpepsin [Dactylella cylindrospora]|nr:Barrierpepsin [Dactylella cylindrospora]